MELDWKKVAINVIAKKVFNLSMMKIEIDTVRTEFSKKESSTVLYNKKTVEKELDEYLKVNLNPQKIQEIIEKRKSRSMNRLSSYQSTQLSASGGLSTRRGSIVTFKSTSSELFRPVADLALNLRKQKTAQTQRDFISFEDSKKKYLKHF